jgi:inner membrane protein
VDNLTHSLTGLALAQTGLSRRSRGAMAALVIASNLPDVDLIFGLRGTAAYLEHHRDLSHSIVGAPLLAVALALALRAVVKRSRLSWLLLCCLVGVAGHVFMDLWTSYGTRVLSPFHHRFYAWDLVFIVDPLILALLLGTVLLARRPVFGARAAAVGLALLLAYVGGRNALHARALTAALAPFQAGAVADAAALPHPFDPFRWRAIVDTGPAYWTGEIRLNGASAPLARRDKLPETAAVARVREASPLAGVFLEFSRFPWLEVEQTSEGMAVVWRDLRFERKGRDSFTTRIVVGRDGRIRSETFRF